MSTRATVELQFDPPGPGFWEQDAVHFPRPVTRYWAEMHPEPFARGFRELTSYYGMLIDTLDYRYLDGFAYKTVVPVADSDVPSRFQRAEEAIEAGLNVSSQSRSCSRQSFPSRASSARLKRAGTSLSGIGRTVL